MTALATEMKQTLWIQATFVFINLVKNGKILHGTLLVRKVENFLSLFP